MKRFSKIFAVVLTLVMCIASLCIPTSAVIPDSSLEVDVKLDKVTTVGEVVDAEGNDAANLGNIYKVTISYKATDGLQKMQAAVVFDDTLFDVCWGDDSGNYFAYVCGDEYGYTAAKTWLDAAADTNTYDVSGNTGASGPKVKAYGLGHVSAGTTYVAEKVNPTSEQYITLTTKAYPGEAVPANRACFIASYKASTACGKDLILGTGEQDLVSVYLKLKDGKTDADVVGTELRLTQIDYSGVALENMNAYGSYYGFTKSDELDTYASFTADGKAYTYTLPSPVYAKGSQIRFNGTEADGAKANFDVRTRAALKAEDFAAICGSEDNAKALAAAGKLQVGFVYTAGTMDVATAKAVATGTAADGYKNVPVTYIQSTGTEYVWTCLIKNADYNASVQALGYIIVDGTAYYFDAASETTFSTLYDAWYDDYTASLS